MKTMSLRAFAIAGLVAAATPAVCEDLDFCHFGKRTGTCSASHTLDRQTNFYTIQATGVCRTVLVQIDETVYPHTQRLQPIVDSVTVFHKDRPYEVSIAGCITHPTKEEVVVGCLNARSYCPADISNEQARACAYRVAESVNACIGARAFDIRQIGTKYSLSPLNF